MLRTLGTLVIAAIVACRGNDTRRASPPNAEFLVAAGDSTWWVRSGPEGVRIRSAPILLTRSNGRFYEVFVDEDAQEYEDASFLMARVMARDLLGKDSVLLYEDSTVRKEVSAWKRNHPDAIPLTPDEELDAEDPGTGMSDEINVVDVHGAYVSFGHSIDIDVRGRTAHTHLKRNGVVDARNGKRMTLADLFGAPTADSVLARGRAALQQMKDSIARTSDARAQRAQAMLPTFQLDANSFSLIDIARQPAVTFVSVGRNNDGVSVVLNVPPVPAAEQPWWNDVRQTLPEWSGDSASLKWTLPAYRVRATPTADGESLDLAVEKVSAKSGDRSVSSWALSQVAIPAYQVIALDGSLTKEMRDALSRAFDESLSSDGLTQRVSNGGRAGLHRRAAMRRTSGQRARHQRSVRAVVRRVAND